MKEYIIDEEYENVRLDRFLRKHFPNIPLSTIFQMIRKGKIKVNSKKKNQDYRLILGDEIKVFIEDDSVNKIQSQQKNEIFLQKILKNDRIFLKNLIKYENDDIFICEKPASISMHDGSKTKESMLSKYRSYYAEQNIEASKINFVNRLDKETSGLVIGVKNIKTARLLSSLIQANKVEKRYFILVHGRVKQKEFVLTSYLKKLENAVDEKKVKTEGYKESISHFKLIREYENYSLLEATLKSGRTHQLRVQLSGIGHPIVGDSKYGVKGEKRLYLYSHYIKISSLNIELDMKIPEFFIEKIKI